jgi:hypothetical protein
MQGEDEAVMWKQCSEELGANYASRSVCRSATGYKTS